MKVEINRHDLSQITAWAKSWVMRMRGTMSSYARPTGEKVMDRVDTLLAGPVTVAIECDDLSHMASWAKDWMATMRGGQYKDFARPGGDELMDRVDKLLVSDEIVAKEKTDAE